ncbi:MULTISPECIES: RloB family protein [Bacillus]|uniref:RloB family protein n=1 Tax=Bacillus TaxID=1386 RepID=UPI0011AB1291|nr:MULTISPECIES: RloB family protein [Bacillus]MCY7862910.1 RloB family protein [Bacillus haynesii]MED4323222.1 RloB family protein [Bacillus licheniformis]
MGTDNLFHKKRNKNQLKRKERIRDLPDSFLIVCEGKKTEPRYFESFRVRSARVKIVGTGSNTISLVEETIELMKCNSYDQVWCVFDRDSFKAGNFYTAIQRALKNGIKVAYSNEAFELWYLLHFHYLDTAINRQQYVKKLNDFLGRKYKKNDPNMYNLLKSKQSTAIKNAKRLLESYTSQNPENNKPSTTVHLLVEELNKFK